MLAVYQIHTFLYALLQQTQIALQQQEIQKFICTSSHSATQRLMLDRATTPLLLSALQFNRQMSRLKANESEQAAQVWKTLCLPLKQFPSSGRLLLNEKTNEPELKRRLTHLAVGLGGTELRVLRGFSWLVLYLFNGYEVCLLCLIESSLFSEEVLDAYFSQFLLI